MNYLFFDYTYNPAHNLSEVVKEYNKISRQNISEIKPLMKEFYKVNRKITEGEVLRIPVLPAVSHIHQNGLFVLNEQKVLSSGSGTKQYNKQKATKKTVVQTPSVDVTRAMIDNELEKRRINVKEYTKKGETTEPKSMFGALTADKSNTPKSKVNDDKADNKKIKDSILLKKQLKQDIINKQKEQEEQKMKKDKPKSTIKRPTEKKGTDKYKTFPYTFSRPNETVQAVIRLYNDMKISSQIQEWLMTEFNKLNKENLPPKLGTKVEIPVLLPFVNRHIENRSVFNDGKNEKNG